MAIRPFANSPHAEKNDISVSWLIGVQTGNTPNAVSQMKYLTVDEFTAYVRSTYGSMWNYRGESSSATPTDPEVNDYFVCTGNFTEGGQSFVSGHLYAYNGNTWDDVSNVLNQYAKQSTVNSLSSRVSAVEAVLPTTVKKADIVDALDSSDATKVLSAKQGKVLDEKIAAISGGVIFKGECTYAELLAIQNPEAGWEYYVTDKEAFYLYSVEDGWVKTAGTVVQTPDETDITHALSNAVTTQIVENAKGAGIKANNRIDNMCDIEGAKVTVNYRGTNDVPPNKAKYALVESIVGKSRAWNQLMQGGDFTSNSDFSLSYCSLSVQNHIGTITLTDTVISARIRKVGENIPLTENHKVFLSIKVNPSKTTNCAFYVGGNWTENISVTANTWQTINIITTIGNIGYECGFGFDRTGDLAVNDTVQVREWFVRDLTLIFPEGVPSTVAECVQKCPDLLKYDAFGTRMVDTTVEGVKSKGFNLWDGTFSETNKYIKSDGTLANDGSWKVTDYIEIKPNTAYYFLNLIPDPSTSAKIAFYDSDKNFISVSNITNGFSATSPLNAKYVRCSRDNSATNTCINISGSLDGTYKPYVEPSTLSLPSSVTLRSAGTVADTDELNVEVLVDGQKVNRRRKTKKVGSYTFTGDETFTDRISMYGRVDFEGLQSVIKPSLDIGDILISGFKVVTAGVTTSVATENQIAVTSDGRVLIQIPSESTLAGYKSYLQGRVLNYALATESATLLDPIENNTIQTEGGGTINTIQDNVYPDDSPAPTIDNSMDVGYYDTKSVLQGKLEDGTIVVGKAQKDASGNVITSTYATKSELTSEATARANADTDLKSAIDANSKRITNLETKAGDEIPVTYPSATYGMDGVPASVAPYGKVKELIMNSRVRNNHIQGGDFTDGGTLDSAMGTVTYNSNGITSVLPSNTYYEQAFTKIFADTIKAGRVVLIGLVGDNIPKRLYNGNTNVLSIASSKFNVVTLTGDVDRLKFGPYSLSETTTYNWKYCILRDLNTYFNTSDLSFLGATDSDKLATIQTNYPELLIPSDYDTGTRVDTTYDEIKSISPNMADPSEIEQGYYATTGYNPSDGYRTTGMMAVEVGETYVAGIFDGSETFVNDVVFSTFANATDEYAIRQITSGSTITIQSGENYIRVRNFGAQTTLVQSGNYKFKVMKGSTLGSFAPYGILGTLTLPSPVTGKSAGSVHQIYYPDTGEMTEPIGEYTITGSESFNPTGGNQYIITGWGQAQGAKLVSAGTVANLLCSFAIPDSYNNANVNGQVGKIALDDRGYLLVTSDIRNNWSNLVGKKISYELASHNPNSQATEPVLDPFIKVDGGGTIRPVQTQTTQIDSAMSVDYLGV